MALPKPPDTFVDFVERFPQLGAAWRQTQQAGAEGPLDEKTVRIAKLALAIGTRQEGVVHSAVRKAVAAGVTEAECDQIIALAAGTIGFPATVAVFSWIREELAKAKSSPSA